MTTLLTGCAGFIGMHVARALLARGERVLGIDDLNRYYDPALKRARLARLTEERNFSFHRHDIAERAPILDLVSANRDIERIVHLAAQPGVRHSLIDPFIYVTANAMGHLVLLEAARRCPSMEHFVYASSSSVYGGNPQRPSRETDDVSSPLSLYAATKRADELMSETYRHLFGLPQTGLRFFTVYGPWGRPDMAVHAFASAIDEGRAITLYDGDPARDFTYIDDIVAGVLAALDRPPGADQPARLLNVGNERPEPVSRLIGLLERHLGRRAIVEHVPRPGTDAETSCASIEAIRTLTGWTPETTLEEGIPRFIDWFRTYRGSPAASAISV